MTLLEHLEAARGLLEGGWSEPWCRGVDGRMVDELDEAVYRWSVLGALRATHTPGTADAWELLERLACPLRGAFDAATRAGDVLTALSLSRHQASGDELQAWLERRGRTIGDVLNLFDAACARAATMALSSAGRTHR